MNIEERMKHYEGICLEKLQHIPAVSFYNHNYYIGINPDGVLKTKDLVYAESDDDDTTVLYLVTNKSIIPFGYCYTSQHDKIHVDKDSGR